MMMSDKHKKVRRNLIDRIYQKSERMRTSNLPLTTAEAFRELQIFEFILGGDDNEVIELREEFFAAQ